MTSSAVFVAHANAQNPCCQLSLDIPGGVAESNFLGHHLTTLALQPFASLLFKPPDSTQLPVVSEATQTQATAPLTAARATNKQVRSLIKNLHSAFSRVLMSCSSTAHACRH